jgi:hypothetical protein
MCQPTNQTSWTHYHLACDTDWGQNLEQFSMQNLDAKPRIWVAICHSRIPRSRSLFAIFQMSVSSISYVILAQYLLHDSIFFVLARIVQTSFCDLILIEVVGVSIRPKMSKCYQFGVIQADAFGIPPNRLKKGGSSMSPL